MLTSNMLLSLKKILLCLHVCVSVYVRAVPHKFLYTRKHFYKYLWKSDDISVSYLCSFLSKDNETAEICMVYIVYHVNEASMMWKNGISILYFCSFPMTGRWLLLHCFMFYPQIKPWSFTVQDLQASNNEAKSFSYLMSYFKPRVSKGTYINVM